MCRSNSVRACPYMFPCLHLFFFTVTLGVKSVSNLHLWCQSATLGVISLTFLVGNMAGGTGAGNRMIGHSNDIGKRAGIRGKGRHDSAVRSVSSQHARVRPACARTSHVFCRRTAEILAQLRFARSRPCPHSKWHAEVRKTELSDRLRTNHDMLSPALLTAEVACRCAFRLYLNCSLE